MEFKFRKSKKDSLAEPEKEIGGPYFLRPLKESYLVVSTVYSNGNPITPDKLEEIPIESKRFTISTDRQSINEQKIIAMLLWFAKSLRTSERPIKYISYKPTPDGSYGEWLNDRELKLIPICFLDRKKPEGLETLAETTPSEPVVSEQSVIQSSPCKTNPRTPYWYAKRFFRRSFLRARYSFSRPEKPEEIIPEIKYDEDVKAIEPEIVYSLVEIPFIEEKEKRGMCYMPPQKPLKPRKEDLSLDDSLFIFMKIRKNRRR